MVEFVSVERSPHELRAAGIICQASYLTYPDFPATLSVMDEKKWLDGALLFALGAALSAAAIIAWMAAPPCIVP